MRKALVTIVLILTGCYLALHVILGSRPVQRRVLQEIGRALSGIGLDLQMESIEFSALSPKIYLNRVTLSSTPKAEVQLPHPLKIDKIKIEFQPLALIARELLIDEVVLFHPTIIVPRSDRLFKKISSLIADKKRIEMKGSSNFTVKINRIGIVDAGLDIQSVDPPFSLRSPSVTTFLQNNVSRQQSVTLQSNHLEVQRGAARLDVTGIDIDLDLGPKSLRVNKAILESAPLGLNIKGASSLPKKGELPDSLYASYDIRASLGFLNTISDLKLPPLEGTVNLSGTLRLSDGNRAGLGSLTYDRLGIQGYQFGKGTLAYELNEKKIALSSIRLGYAGGEVRSKYLTIELKDRYAMQGDLDLDGIGLEGILDSVKSGDTPVLLGFNGSMKVTGFLAGPLELHSEVNTELKNFAVLQNVREGRRKENVVLSVANGSFVGALDFTKEKMGLHGDIDLLDGKIRTDGYIGFKQEAKIQARAEKLSLTKLDRISALQVGGVSDLEASIEVSGTDASIHGTFSVTGAQVASVVLGKVRGEANFKNMLLAFEKLVVESSLEPILGNGFVDFRGDHTQYRFVADSRRMGMDEAFAILRKQKLSFPIPTSGDLSGRVTIEGGKAASDVEIKASGQGHNFKWVGEDWLSANFSLTYNSQGVDLDRLVLFKKSGGIEMQGRFWDTSSYLNILSHGLRLEELNTVGRAPLTGELVGELRFTGDLSELKGNGEIKLIRTTFRGTSLRDSSVNLTSSKQGTEWRARVLGEELEGRLNRSLGPKPWSLVVKFSNFDLAPMIAILMKKDVPSLTEVTASGELNLSGDFSDLRSLQGGGSLRTLSVGLKGTPMRNRHPIQLKLDGGAVKLDDFQLAGNDSQLSVGFSYSPKTWVQGSLDGKADLQFLQPFIPALEYGTGKVSVGLRLSGKPDAFEMLGNVELEDGTFRLNGLNDDFRNADVRISVSQEKINIDRFEASVNGGTLAVGGEIRINRFRSLIPNLTLTANRVSMRTGNFLTTRFSGELFLRGRQTPYLLGGKCRLLEATLSRFEGGKESETSKEPIFQFDVDCEAKEKLFVDTDVMNAEFKGHLHLTGDDREIGLLGSVDSIRGLLIVKDKKFNLTSASVRFESADHIAPRFNVSGRASVTELRQQAAQVYEVNVNVFGTPSDYKIRLTSSPALAEADIISLLLLGVTSRSQMGGNYMDLGSSIVGQIPMQSKLQSELGLDIKINQQASKNLPANPPSTATAITDITVPSVQIQKEITNKTKLSYSNTLETNPVRELKIEHMLDENFSVNGTAVDKVRSPVDSSTVQTYGLDFRYRFQFE